MSDVAERLAEPPPVAGDDADATARSRPRARCPARAGQALRRPRPPRAHRCGEVDLVLGEQQAAGVALGQIEDIVDQRAEPADAVEDRRDIVGRGRRQLAGIARGEHLGEAGDRGQRRAQLVAHVGDEGGLQPVRLLERLVAVAQRRLDLPAVGDVEHGEERVAVGQRHRGELELAAVDQRRPGPTRCLRSTVALRTSSRTSPAWLARFSLAASSGVSASTRGWPASCSSSRPQNSRKRLFHRLQPAVRGEHADRLEQIVEGRGADPQQGVARRGELDLLGPVLEDESAGRRRAAAGRRRADACRRAAANPPRRRRGRW